MGCISTLNVAVTGISAVVKCTIRSTKWGIGDTKLILVCGKSHFSGAGMAFATLE